VLGALVNQVALLNGLSMVTLPLLSVFLDQPRIITEMSLALVVLMVIKRLEANQQFRPLRRDVWLNRLLHDRDAY
jgi:hypothetical protein